MSDNVYDVVVVGAGIAGAIVARQLAEKGHSVLVLEAGKGGALTSEGYRAFVDRYQGTPNEFKVPNSPYPNNPNAPQSSVLDTDPNQLPNPSTRGYFVQYGPLPFSSSNTRNAGGTTLHWLGTCLRMLPQDFEMQKRFGHGVDWPIGYSDLQPYYRRAEEEIGVSADAREQAAGVPGLPIDERYHYPMKKIPPSYLDRTVGDRVKGWSYTMGTGDCAASYPIQVVSTPQGRNSTPNPDYAGPQMDRSETGFMPVGSPYDIENHVGERCEGNSSCIPICPVQAKYTAVRSLLRSSKPITIQVQSVATTVDIDPDTGKITGVHYTRYSDSDVPLPSASGIARGRTYVLAAHTIENPKILLASGACRTSDQVGRNLMDHPTMLVFGKIPTRLGSYRGPGSTSGIPSLRDGSFRSQHAAFRVEIGNWGWNWAKGAPTSTVNDMLSGSRPPFGARLRRALYDECQQHIRMAFLIEQTPDPTNRVTIDPAYKDALGNYRPIISYDLDDYTKAGLYAGWRFHQDLFARVGIQDHSEEQFAQFDPAGTFIYNGTKLAYYGAGHQVGTHRMGSSASDSVVDSDCRAWDHDNLYLVGCGSMPTIGTSNPTLTLGALAMKASDAIHRYLETGR